MLLPTLNCDMRTELTTSAPRIDRRMFPSSGCRMCLTPGGPGFPAVHNFRRCIRALPCTQHSEECSLKTERLMVEHGHIMMHTSVNLNKPVDLVRYRLFQPTAGNRRSWCLSSRSIFRSRIVPIDAQLEEKTRRWAENKIATNLS